MAVINLDRGEGQAADKAKLPASSPIFELVNSLNHNIA